MSEAPTGLDDALAIRALVDLQTNLDAKVKFYRQKQKFEIVDILADLESFVQARIEAIQGSPPSDDAESRYFPKPKKIPVVNRRRRK